MREYIKNKQRKNAKIKKYFTIIVFALFIVSLFNVFKWKISNNLNEKISEDTAKAVTEKLDENRIKYNVDFQKLKEQNEDTVAWLKIHGTNIEYPVVQANDNDYYLRHNFDKKYSSAGWIFADYRNKFDELDKNIVIYGHNILDDSMFGTLKNVLEEDWYNSLENREIIFITENSEFIYKVFSIYQIENENYYINTDFSDNKEYATFLTTILKRSVVDFEENINDQDKIITISTCANNSKYRIVLHAKMTNR